MCCCAATYQKITVWTSEKIPKPACSTFLHHSALGQPLLGYGHVEPYVMRLGGGLLRYGIAAAQSRLRWVPGLGLRVCFQSSHHPVRADSHPRSCLRKGPIKCRAFVWARLWAAPGCFNHRHHTRFRCSAQQYQWRMCVYHRQNDLGACIVQFFDQWAQFRRAFDWLIGGDCPSARALRPLCFFEN